MKKCFDVISNLNRIELRGLFAQTHGGRGLQQDDLLNVAAEAEVRLLRESKRVLRVINTIEF
jgi:hypothetical protein